MNERIDRRTFLRRTAIGSAGLAAVGLGIRNYLRDDVAPWERDAFPPIGEARVAVLRATSYDQGLETVVLDGLRAVGTQVQGARVLLKPNFVEYDTRTVVNTDPRLVAATVLVMRRLGAATVTVGEGPGHRRDTQYVITSSGLMEALSDVNAPFVDLNADALVSQRLRSHYTPLGSLWIPKSITDSDVVVSMPKMKTHHWTGVTLSMKNCFGSVPGRVYGWPKNALHVVGIERSILDVTGAVRPDLAIVDGIVGMDGNGPISGSPVEAGVLVFGNDPVATDVTAARLMNIDPERVAYLAEAGRFLGQADPDRIRQVGENPEREVTDFTLLPQFAYLKVGSDAEPITPPDTPAF